jgi:4-hydroxy-2-oxoglutarate aldolase
MKLQGIFLPVTVPFDHNGEIYPVKVEHNVEKWNRTSISGYVVSGPENSFLSSDEKARMWEWVAQYAAPEKTLIAAVGMPSVHETIALANRAASLGYKLALVRGEGDLYFRSIADRAQIPVIVNAEVAHPNIVAVVADRFEDIKPGFIAGTDAALSDAFAAGATAAIATVANAIPYACISIWEAHRTRDFEAAKDWQKRIAAAVKSDVAGLKHAMDLNGYYGGPPRLPLTVPTTGQRREIERAFDGIKG